VPIPAAYLARIIIGNAFVLPPSGAAAYPPLQPIVVPVPLPLLRVRRRRASDPISAAGFKQMQACRSSTSRPTTPSVRRAVPSLSRAARPAQSPHAIEPLRRATVRAAVLRRRTPA
jgi:hypothetical protein